MFQSMLLGGLPYLTGGESRAINAENPRGEKGKGGTAASHLGPSRKGSPCIGEIKPGETALLGEMEGPGVIEHIWITVTDKTSDADRFVLRDLVLRMYWDGEETPSVEAPLGDFFCCGFGQGCLVNSLPVAVNPNRGFNCYFPMPFRKSARLTVENQHKNPVPAFFYQSTTACTRSCRRTPATSTPSGGGRPSPTWPRTTWCWTGCGDRGSTWARTWPCPPWSATGGARGR